MSRRAAVTIVSKNYLPAARVLAQSFRAHHPDADFYVLLVDRIDGHFDPAAEPFKLIPLDQIRLPRFDVFVYQYTILELNTAVKPFVLEWLFKHEECDQVVYLDPDIEVFRPLEAVWNALDESNLVLIPHMRKPFFDEASPTELAVLQSGTYNLGFAGLARSRTTEDLLDWWQRKMYTDCVVDIPRGLFVDQKWMDLATGYFQGTTILRDPSYNVAYWNLHDREVTHVGDNYFVDGTPLAFFHFSGYLPTKPDTLSKHQSRHSLLALPGVRDLCAAYGEKLFANGYSEASAWPYVFDKLPNGVEVSRLMRLAIRRCVARSVPFPSPMAQPDELCRFMLTVNPWVTDAQLTPLQHAIVEGRPDVAKAFPGIRSDPDDKGFNEWIASSGVREEKLGPLLRFEPTTRTQEDLVDRVFRDLEDQKRNDVFEHHKNLWAGTAAFADFVYWVGRHGLQEFSWAPETVEAMKRVEHAPLRLLDMYFANQDLQKSFKDLDNPEVVDRLCDWFRSHCYALEITTQDVSMFRAFARRHPKLLRWLGLAYNEVLRTGLGGVTTIYDLLDNEAPASLLPDRDALFAYLCSAIDRFLPIDQARIYLQNRVQRNQFKASQMATSALSLRTPDTSPRMAQAINKGLADARSGKKREGQRLNVAGHFSAMTGMGESARSMTAVAIAAGYEVECTTIPTAQDAGPIQELPHVFGMPKAEADLSIAVCNANTVQRAHRFLPRHFWADRNVGYWVWESDRFPYEFRDSAIPFDEIWTPSSASAEAIRATVDRPVHVLPHALNLDAIDGARSQRVELGLPVDALIVGFFFDHKSILQRKNPLALLEAFERAFGDDPAARLLIKVNSAARGDFDYEKFRAAITQPNVILMERTLSRRDTLNLVASLDVYASLHSSEGFGLTCAEAMAMGKPVVATAHSGNMDFMSGETACLVQAELEETTRPYGPYPARTRWAKPDTEQAAQHLQSLQDGLMRKSLGDRGREHVRRLLSPEAVARTMQTILRQGSRNAVNPVPSSAA